MSDVTDYFRTLSDLPAACEAADANGGALSLETALDRLVAAVGDLKDYDGKLMFVGNGGSASICSHMAIDFTKNAGVPALCFNDGAALTCLGNDLGYENVFVRQIEAFARPGDLLFAISSSGNSDNIVAAAEAARTRGCRVATLSGFRPDNRLRRLGDVNIWAPSGEYGFVEIVHLALCHAVLDLAMGWTAGQGLWSAPAQQTEAAA